jgi:hypothetical protein
MARRNRSSQVKREREQKKRERQRRKAEKAAQKRERRFGAGDEGAADTVDPEAQVTDPPHGKPAEPDES